MSGQLSIAQALKWGREQLSASESARLDVQVLLGFVLAKPNSYLHTWPERALTADQQAQFAALIAQRQQGEPIAYLVGEREFWSLPLKVHRSTLIPRPDTEVLVETALTLPLPEHANVLDLGTGTGAIALALKSERPLWQITGVDAQIDAVTLAQHNAKNLNLDVVFAQSDWFKRFEQHTENDASQRQFDLIVSNPPYIDAQDPHLQQGDVRFEPHSALVASDAGLADIADIIGTAPQYLAENGWLVLEHGWQQAAQVQAIFRQGAWQRIQTRQDYANLDRLTLAQLSYTEQDET